MTAGTYRHRGNGTGHLDQFSLPDPGQRGIDGIHHDDVAAGVAPVQVILVVDHRVELPLGADGHEVEPLHRLRNINDVEVPTPVVGAEVRLMERAAGDLEFTLGFDPGDGSVTGHDRSDGLAQAVMVAQQTPVEAVTAHRPLREPCQDVGLGAQLTVDERLPTGGQTHVIEHRFLRSGLLLLIAGEHRQDHHRLTIAVEVAGVQFGRQTDSDRDPLQGLRRPVRIRIAGPQIAPHQHRDIDVTGMSGADTGVGVLPRLDGDTEAPPQLVGEDLFERG